MEARVGDDDWRTHRLTRFDIQDEHLASPPGDSGVSSVGGEVDTASVDPDLVDVPDRAGLQVDQRPPSAEVLEEPRGVQRPGQGDGRAVVRSGGDAAHPLVEPTDRPTGASVAESSMVTRPEISPITRRVPSVL